MLTFQVQTVDGETDTIEAGYVNGGEGLAWFFTPTGRLLRIVPVIQIRRVDVVWPVDEADRFDAHSNAQRAAQQAAKEASSAETDQ